MQKESSFARERGQSRSLKRNAADAYSSDYDDLMKESKHILNVIMASTKRVAE